MGWENTDLLQGAKEQGEAFKEVKYRVSKTIFTSQFSWGHVQITYPVHKIETEGKECQLHVKAQRTEWESFQDRNTNNEVTERGTTWTDQEKALEN